MGLETSTYISGLTNTWPVSGDPKSQGDDHIRLIKQVLQTTFPNATAPLYFPKGEAISGTLTLDATDQNNVVMVTTTSADVTVNLPTLAAAQAGWSCEVVKVTADGNAAVVVPPSGTILSQVGPTVNIRVGALAQPARFIWSGSVFICVKPGAPIGGTQNFDGNVPWGYLLLDGSAFSSTTYRELFLALGSVATLKDKRGRVEAGVDGGAGRLSATYFGTSPIAGAVGGAESTTLTSAQSGEVAHSHNVFLTDPGHGHSLNNATTVLNQGAGGSVWPGGVGGGTLNISVNNNTTGITIGPSAGTGGNVTSTRSGASAASGHSNVQHTIVTNKWIRAC